MLIADMTIDFFYGHADVPKLGADGTAYSTVFVELIALVWCVAESYHDGHIHADKKGLQWFSADITKDFIKISASMLGSSLAWGVGFSLHSLIMGHLGTDATAAASIVSVVQQLVTCVCKGISADAGIIVGKLLDKSCLNVLRNAGDCCAWCPFQSVLLKWRCCP